MAVTKSKRLGDRAAAEAAAIPVRFEFRAPPGAVRVSVAGDFNDWDASAKGLESDGEGCWSGVLLLHPGRYQYKFVVDGTRWYEDPRAAQAAGNEFGGTNSVVEVGA